MGLTPNIRRKNGAWLEDNIYPMSRRPWYKSMHISQVISVFNIAYTQVITGDH